MNDLTSMYDQSADLDTRLESASHMLKEAADKANFDLNKLSSDELSNLLMEMIEGTPDNDNGKIASSQEQQPVEGEGPTVAEVSFELTKRAAAGGLDLTRLEPEQYSELFDKVAEEMRDPAAAEEAQKLAAEEARMDELGRVAARGFVDEVNKLAADEEDAKKDKKEDDDEDEDDKKKMASAKEKAKAVVAAAKGGLKNFGGKAQTFAKKNDKALLSGGSAGAGGAAGYAAGKRKGEKNASIEAAAVKLARDTLLANGIDPDTGTKIASDDVLVRARATELLQEAGYSL